MAPLRQARLSALILSLAAAACAGGGEKEPAAPGAPDASATALRTEAQRRGADLYKREHCGRCHTLSNVPSAAGVFLAPAPPAQGWLSRVGPDLGAEGHRRSDDWHFAHLYAPALVVRGSPMTPARHLFRPDPDGLPRPTSEARDLVAFLQALGRARRDTWAEMRRGEPRIPPAPLVDQVLRERGDALYRQHCAACHGPAGDGRGEVASLLEFHPRDFVAGRYRFRSTPSAGPPADADLFRTITLGTGIGAAMPAFDWLPAPDRWALVARIKEFSPVLRGTPLVSPSDGGPHDGNGSVEPDASSGGGRAIEDERDRLLVRGRRLWEELGCASCHGGAGAGLGRGEAAEAAWVDQDGAPVPRSSNLTHACALRGGASAAAIDRAIFGEGLAMPSYAEAVPERGDRQALREYVLSLQDRPEGP